MNNANGTNGIKGTNSGDTKALIIILAIIVAIMVWMFRTFPQAENPRHSRSNDVIQYQGP